MDVSAVSGDLIREVEQFLFREARLQDEHQYESWEKLWTDDAIYWVPANGDDIDPEKDMSIIYDNRSRIGVRVRQLLSGKRFTQMPVSRLRRSISNIEVLDQNGPDLTIGSNVFIFESNNRGETLWAARVEHRLRLEEGGLRMAFKKVMLVNNDKAIYTLSFLI
jgi:3-phenylpropionate/cinnamic acid dioxygenase small subunit